MVNGAGALIFCTSTNRVLLGLRGKDCVDPNVWCPFGGKIEEGESPEETARREIMEEIGYGSMDPIADEYLTLIPALLYKDDKLTFHNHIAPVANEFTPTLNWETEDYKWCHLHEIPDPEHYGLTALLSDNDTLDIIDTYRDGKAAVTPATQVSAGSSPFLSKLGLSVNSQAVFPTKEAFPLAFNPNNYRVWTKAVDSVPENKEAKEAWALAISAYIKLCTHSGFYPFTNVHQSANDSIIQDLVLARKSVVKFLNRTGILKLVKIRTTTRQIVMTTTGFVVKVYGQAVLKDPSFAEWLRTTPRFDIVKQDQRFHKRLDKNSDLFVYNEGANLTGRWHVGYEIVVNSFPDIPGNATPSKAELEDFILRILYMPILLSHRPFGHTHRLL